MAEEIRRRLAALTEEDTDTGGRPKLFAYGYGHLEAHGVSRWLITQAVGSDIPLHLPVEATAWLLAKAKHADLADQVLEVLGYAPRYGTKTGA